MRKLNKRKVFLACALAFSGSVLPAHATGIPVFDAASAMNMVQQLQQAKQQYDQLVKEYQQAKNLHDSTIAEGKRLYEGVTNFKVQDLLDDPTLSSYLPNKNSADALNQVSGNISSLRSQYGLSSDQPVVQKAYDSLLSELENMQTAYNTAVKRGERLNTLSEQLESAVTPQEKADYQSAIQTEQNNLLNEKTKLDLAKANFDQNLKVVQAGRRAEFKQEFSVDK